MSPPANSPYPSPYSSGRPSQRYDQFRPARRRGRLLGLFFVVIWLAIIGAVAAYRQPLSDWWRLRGYQPPAAVVQLADQDTMTSYTRHLFYLNRPQLLPTVSGFRADCPEDEDTIVLGCYHPEQDGIFIYQIQNPTLYGVQQVTAAHEVLHAVYGRLNSKAKASLDTELQNYYEHDLHDARVLAEVQIYQKTEPTDVFDEMSCTFGTEVANLPASLEAYYKQFFTNRQAIVAYEQRYQGTLTALQNTVTTDDQQLATLKQQTDDQQTTLNTQYTQITSDRARLNSLQSSGQISAYNAAVPAFNSEVDSYNSGVNSLQAAIAHYNQLVVTRNQVAGQLTTLDKALDTRVTKQVSR
jgi:hypothetical protein